MNDVSMTTPPSSPHRLLPKIQVASSASNPLGRVFQRLSFSAAPKNHPNSDKIDTIASLFIEKVQLQSASNMRILFETQRAINHECQGQNTSLKTISEVKGLSAIFLDYCGNGFNGQFSVSEEGLVCPSQNGIEKYLRANLRGGAGSFDVRDGMISIPLSTLRTLATNIIREKRAVDLLNKRIQEEMKGTRLEAFSIKSEGLGKYSMGYRQEDLSHVGKLPMHHGWALLGAAKSAGFSCNLVNVQKDHWSKEDFERVVERPILMGEFSGVQKLFQTFREVDALKEAMEEWVQNISISPAYAKEVRIGLGIKYTPVVFNKVWLPEEDPKRKEVSTFIVRGVEKRDVPELCKEAANYKTGDVSGSKELTCLGVPFFHGGISIYLPESDQNAHEMLKERLEEFFEKLVFKSSSVEGEKKKFSDLKKAQVGGFFLNFSPQEIEALSRLVRLEVDASRTLIDKTSATQGDLLFHQDLRSANILRSYKLDALRRLAPLMRVDEDPIATVKAILDEETELSEEHKEMLARLAVNALAETISERGRDNERIQQYFEINFCKVFVPVWDREEQKVTNQRIDYFPQLLGSTAWSRPIPVGEYDQERDQPWIQAFAALSKNQDLIRQIQAYVLDEKGEAILERLSSCQSLHEVEKMSASIRLELLLSNYSVGRSIWVNKYPEDSDIDAFLGEGAAALRGQFMEPVPNQNSRNWFSAFQGHAAALQFLQKTYRAFENLSIYKESREVQHSFAALKSLLNEKIESLGRFSFLQIRSLPAYGNWPAFQEVMARFARLTFLLKDLDGDQKQMYVEQFASNTDLWRGCSDGLKGKFEMMIENLLSTIYGDSLYQFAGEKRTLRDIAFYMENQLFRNMQTQYLQETRRPLPERENVWYRLGLKTIMQKVFQHPSEPIASFTSRNLADYPHIVWAKKVVAAHLPKMINDFMIQNPDSSINVYLSSLKALFDKLRLVEDGADFDQFFTQVGMNRRKYLAPDGMGYDKQAIAKDLPQAVFHLLQRDGIFLPRKREELLLQPQWISEQAALQTEEMPWNSFGADWLLEEANRRYPSRSQPMQIDDEEEKKTR